MTSAYWEEDFLGDRVELHDADGKLVGDVRPIGGSWQVTRVKSGKGEVVGTRPDKVSAQFCLIQLLEAEQK